MQVILNNSQRCGAAAAAAAAAASPAADDACAAAAAAADPFLLSLLLLLSLPEEEEFFPFFFPLAFAVAVVVVDGELSTGLIDGDDGTSFVNLDFFFFSPPPALPLPPSFLLLSADLLGETRSCCAFLWLLLVALLLLSFFDDEDDPPAFFVVVAPPLAELALPDFDGLLSLFGALLVARGLLGLDEAILRAPLFGEGLSFPLPLPLAILYEQCGIPRKSFWCLPLGSITKTSVRWVCCRFDQLTYGSRSPDCTVMAVVLSGVVRV